MKKRLLRILVVLSILYTLLCTGIYYFQERLIFFPEKLSPHFNFDFEGNYEEITVRTGDGTAINSLLFKASRSKGLIFYLHGNGGSLRTWGEVAKSYTALGYDVFMIDYRGYGKSEGQISSLQQLFRDNQEAYNKIRKRYPEEQIIILGYSIGTGMAARLASEHKPALLILQAPYYSLSDMMRHTYPFLPEFLLRYKLATNEYLQKCTMPVVIFHGNQDEVIYYGSARKLEKEFKPGDTLITLDGQGHNRMTDHKGYQKAITTILDTYRKSRDYTHP